MGSAIYYIDLSYSNMDAAAIVNLFHDLYDRSSESTSGTLNIQYAFGASDAAVAYAAAVAAAKNWTVTGATG